MFLKIKELKKQNKCICGVPLKDLALTPGKVQKCISCKIDYHSSCMFHVMKGTEPASCLDCFVCVGLPSLRQ